MKNAIIPIYYIHSLFSTYYTIPLSSYYGRASFLRADESGKMWNQEVDGNAVREIYLARFAGFLESLRRALDTRGDEPFPPPRITPIVSSFPPISFPPFVEMHARKGERERGARREGKA